MKTGMLVRGIAMLLALGCLSEAARAYINAGFKSESEARAYYAAQRAKVVREMFARWDAALARNPDDAVPYYQRANYHLQTADYAKAWSDYNEALRRDPKLTKAYYRRSFLWARRNEFGKAIADLEELLRLDPKFDRAHRQRAVIFYRCPDERLRDLAKAKESVERACQLRATRRNHQIAAAIAAELGDFAAAVDWATKPFDGRVLADDEHLALLKSGTIPTDYHRWADGSLFGDYEEFGRDRVSLPAGGR